MIEIDGGHGEGGGQLVRTAVALAAVTGRTIRVSAIRARRRKPGLAPQHAAAIGAVAALCGAAVRGLEIGSREIEFRPGVIAGGELRCDVGTAGSVTLVLQALLPAALCARAPVTATLTGGTDVRAAPPLDYTLEVLLPLIERMGARVAVAVVRRGYYPRGGGEVRVRVEPGPLAAFEAPGPGALRGIRAKIHVGNLPGHIVERAIRALAGALAPEPVDVDGHVLGAAQATGSGGAVVAAASLERSTLGAGAVAQRGVPAEQLGSEVGLALAAELAAGSSLDAHATDQLLVFAALARGQSVFTTRALSEHARTTIWLLERVLAVRFDVLAEGALQRVSVQGAGLR